MLKRHASTSKLAVIHRSSFRSLIEYLLGAVPVTDILDGIHLVRATTQIEFLAFMHRLENWLSEHEKVSAHERRSRRLAYDTG